MSSQQHCDTDNLWESFKHMDPKYVSLEECEKVWGRRCFNSHGFKYKKSCMDEDVIAMG